MCALGLSMARERCGRPCASLWRWIRLGGVTVVEI